MSEKLWAEIAAKLNEHSYLRDRVSRSSERVQFTAEVFTPTPLVVEMIQRLPLEALGPRQTVLDPACGDGQFLVAAKWVKIFHHDMSEEDALEDLYGVDIMPDNVTLCRRRLGGGTILVGDSLNPERRVDGQSDEDYKAMQDLFRDDGDQLSLLIELEESHA